MPPHKLFLLVSSYVNRGVIYKPFKSVNCARTSRKLILKALQVIYTPKLPAFEMASLSLGLIKEEKIPVDKRVAFLPSQLQRIEQLYPEVICKVQKSSVRSITDEAYAAAGFEVLEDISHCDILFGIKEVPWQKLIPNKTYLFFSHTIKKQPYNQRLLQEVINRNITLIDYEVIVDEAGNRTVAFGEYAGIVGAYNGIRGYGIKTGAFYLKPAFQCKTAEGLAQELKNAKLEDTMKIAITGAGRVGKGAEKVLSWMGIKKVSAEEYVSNSFNEVVYTVLRSKDYHYCFDNRPWDSELFYRSPELFRSNFRPFYQQTDLLLACAYWNPRAPRLFSAAEMASKDFKISFIADITCDIDGSIPSTQRASTIEEPYYDYKPISGELAKPFSSAGNITVMAVDNLPCELPADASKDFGEQLITHFLPALLGGTDDALVERSTIAKAGKLMPRFEYLSDYVYGKVGV